MTTYSVAEAFTVQLLSLNDNVILVESDEDPRFSPGYPAPIGSLLQNRVSGDLFNKFGTSDTDWNLISIRAGRTLQIFTGNIASLAGTSSIPLSDTLPSITSGSSLWSQALTLHTNENVIYIVVNFSFSASSNEMPAVACIFRDNTCIFAMLLESSANPNVGRPISFSCFDAPGVAGAEINYSCRLGKIDGNGVWYINGTQDHPILFGGVLANAGYQLLEITG